MDRCYVCRRLVALAASDADQDVPGRLRPGTPFAGYVIGETLGAGAMGIVYSARDEALGRRIALKVVRGRANGDGATQSEQARLLREAKAAAALTHPNVVVVHAVGASHGQMFIAMELVSGGTLREWLADRHRSVREIVALFLQAGEGLAAAHAAGVVHRDFKPDNVLVGTDGRPRVADFGVAQLAGDAVDSVPSSARRGLHARGLMATRASALVGTVPYMAPEQLRGSAADSRSDQFAFAVSLYECLYGERPFRRTDLTALGPDPAPRPPGVARGERVPAALRHALVRAMSSDASARFPDMRSFLRALEVSSQRAPMGRVAAWSVAVATVGLAAAVALHRSRTPQDAPTPPASALAPSTSALTDLPAPGSDVPAARAEYVAGIQALRDGSVVPGLNHLTRATELDGSMAAAHLRLAVYGRDVVLPVSAATSFAKAHELRSLLTARDQALLSALEPSFLSVPADPGETRRRLGELAARSPGDAELRYLVAEREPDPSRQMALLVATFEMDPGFALALWRRAALELSVSDVPSAVDTLHRCVAVSPSSTACLTVLTLVDEELGRCADMERDARALEKASPSARSHDLVARALFATGAPAPAVHDALERKWQAASSAERNGYRTVDETNLAVLSGDFETAERLELQAAADAERSTDEDDHKNAVVPLVALYGEMGRTRDAGRVADGYLRARAAWESIGRWSPVPQMLAAAMHAGLRTEAQRHELRAQWLRQWDAMDMLHSQSWVLGYATPASTRDEALEALAAAPQPLPRVPTNQFHREGFGDPGKVLLLAGRSAEALPLLRVAASSCSALAAPLDHTWANLNLGLALEAVGDASGACVAYQVVLDRWGSAKPRSVSAGRARARSGALGCRSGTAPGR